MRRSAPGAMTIKDATALRRTATSWLRKSPSHSATGFPWYVSPAGLAAIRKVAKQAMVKLRRYPGAIMVLNVRRCGALPQMRIAGSAVREQSPGRGLQARARDRDGREPEGDRRDREESGEARFREYDRR